jgi:hypothetical protein
MEKQKYGKRMRRLLLFIILLSHQVYSQQNISTGSVVADDNFNCSKYTFIDPLYGVPAFIDSVYGVKNICESDSQIEIRFTTSHAPTTIFEIVILSFNNDVWSGKKFEFNSDTLYADSNLNAEKGKVKVSDFKSTLTLDSIFRMLTKNNLFSLPGLSEVKRKPQGPSCGLIHTITFKVGNKFRTYSFNNTAYYTEHSKKKIFRNYHNLFLVLSESPWSGEK